MFRMQATMGERHSENDLNKSGQLAYLHAHKCAAALIFLFILCAAPQRTNSSG